MFNYIKSCRKNLGLTQRELGYLIGYENNVRICQIEKGKAKPSFAESIIFELLFEKPNRWTFRDTYYETTEVFVSRIIRLEQHYGEVEQTDEVIHIRRRLRQVRRYVQALNDERI